MTYFAKLKKFFWFFVKLAIAGGIVAYLAFKNPTEIIDGFRSFTRTTPELQVLPA